MSGTCRHRVQTCRPDEPALYVTEQGGYIGSPIFERSCSTPERYKKLLDKFYKPNPHKSMIADQYPECKVAHCNTDGCKARIQ